METVPMPKTGKPEMPFDYTEMFKAIRDRGKFSNKELANNLQTTTRTIERIVAG